MQWTHRLHQFTTGRAPSNLPALVPWQDGRGRITESHMGEIAQGRGWGKWAWARQMQRCRSPEGL